MAAGDRRRRQPRLEHVVTRQGLRDEHIRAWMERDYNYAQQCLARAHAFNELARAQAKYVALGGVMGGRVGEPVRPVKIEMTAQQVFLGFARLYATNEQLAAFLHGRVTEKSLAAIRVALHELKKIVDDGIAPVWVERPDGMIEVDGDFEYVSSEPDVN